MAEPCRLVTVTNIKKRTVTETVKKKLQLQLGTNEYIGHSWDIKAIEKQINEKELKS